MINSTVHKLRGASVKHPATCGHLSRSSIVDDPRDARQPRIARTQSSRPLAQTASGARARMSSTSTMSTSRPQTGEDWRLARVRPNAILNAATRIVAPNTPTSRVAAPQRRHRTSALPPLGSPGRAIGASAFDSSTGASHAGRTTGHTRRPRAWRGEAASLVARTCLAPRRRTGRHVTDRSNCGSPEASSSRALHRLHRRGEAARSRGRVAGGRR